MKSKAAFTTVFFMIWISMGRSLHADDVSSEIAGDSSEGTMPNQEAPNGESAPGVLWGASIWSGYINADSSAEGNVSKSGYILGMRGFGFWQDQAHRYEIGAGFNLNSVSGSSGIVEQGVDQISAVLDAVYAYGAHESIDLGLHLHNEFGGGSHLNFADLDRFEWWGGLGPTLRYKFAWAEMDWMVGVSALWSLTVPEQSQLKVPLSISLVLPNSQRQMPEQSAMEVPAESAEPEQGQPAPNKHQPQPDQQQDAPPALPQMTIEQKKEMIDPPKGRVARISGGNQIKLVFPASRVAFAPGKSEVRGDGKRFLEMLGKALLTHNPNISDVEVVGHTDKTGPLQVNQRISQARAQSVVAALIDGGLEADKAQAHGAGPSEPLQEGDDPASLAANRRVEVTITFTQGGEALAQDLNGVDAEFK